MFLGSVLPILQMVSNYKRKTTQGSWTEQDMKKAIEESKLSSISAASRKYGIPLGTLLRHIQKSSNNKQLGRFRPTFTQEMERELAEQAKYLDDLFYGLTRESLTEVQTWTKR
jgi:hypothetical protein